MREVVIRGASAFRAGPSNAYFGTRLADKINREPAPTCIDAMKQTTGPSST